MRRLPPVTNHYSSLDRLVFKSIYFANIHLIRSIASPNWVINQFIKGQSGQRTGCHYRGTRSIAELRGEFPGEADIGRWVKLSL